MRGEWCVVALALAWPAPAPAQHSASQRLDAAYAQLRARRLDSARVLVHPVTDSTFRATPTERGAAWLLLGIIDYYSTGDSAAARDFRAAFTHTLALRGDWLPQLDSALGVIWRRERGRAMCGDAARESRAALAPGDSARVVDQKPAVLSGPFLNYPITLRQAGIQGRVLMAGIVDSTGHIEPGSVRVIESPHEMFTREALYYMGHAVFRPARIGGHAVRVCVQVPVDFRIRSY